MCMYIYIYMYCSRIKSRIIEYLLLQLYYSSAVWKKKLLENEFVLLNVYTLGL